MATASPHIRVACHVRKSSLVAPVDSTLRQLERLEADDSIDEFTVDAWPAKVRIGDGSPHSDVLALVEEFDAWAAQWYVSIRPPFAVETRTSEITGDTCEVLITPVQCLAIYVNGVLTEVFPHSTDQTGDAETYTVRDALTLLEDYDIQAFGAGQTPATSPSQRIAAAQAAVDPDMCPRCETRFVTGQGLYACPDCNWTGIATAPGRYRPVRPYAAPPRASAQTEAEDESSPASTPRR